jgi:NitT/TauT family transport system ATP-binding protein
MTDLTVGFMPLLDCALLAVAAEKGHAAENGLNLRLVRESSWANIRDRLVVGQFDAAHMLGPMVVAETLGVGQINFPLVAPAALGRGGNAITVSRGLWSQMHAAGAQLGAVPSLVASALGRVVAQRAAGRATPLVFAMVFPFSCHNYELRHWLASGGIDPDRDIRLVVLPPPLLVDALRTGQVDGYCVGEPWNSVAVDSGVGVIATVVSDFWPAAPEKVLGMRADYAGRHPDAVRALVRALAAASRWAGNAANLQELAVLLSEPRYVGVPARLLARALTGEVLLMTGAPPILRKEFLVLSGADATVPAPTNAAWICQQMQRWGQVGSGERFQEQARECFRQDLYLEALREPAK